MTSEGIKKAIEASEKLEKELLSLNKKDQWTLTKPTIQNFKITALDDLKFEYEERCAILEFDAGLTRKKAEEFSKSILSNKSK